MEQITALQAFLIASWVGIVQSRSLGYATLTLRFSPLMTGLVAGLVMGDVAQGMIIAATIQLIYMGAIAPGGSMPSEPAVATAIAVPVAILAGLKPEESIMIAVPVGLLGSYLYQFRFFLNTLLTPTIDRYAEKLNDRGLTISIIWLPILIGYVLFTVMVFIALYYGAPVIADVTSSASGSTLFHILTVIGGGLAALGIGLIIHVIGKKGLIVFFFLAYFMSVSLSSLGINTVTYAIFGAICAALYIMFISDKEEA